MNNLRLVLRIVIPVLVLIMAVGGAIVLKNSKKDPERHSAKNTGTLVQIAEASAGARRIDVAAQGEVVHARSVVLQPRVMGEIVWISDKLIAGGVVEKGEPLVKIDRSDYQLMVDQQKTAVAQAEAQVSLEKGQQDVAKREWELFNKDADPENDPSLALRAPQKRIAEVRLDAAKATLRRAQLDLRRTTIVAPFNAFVRAESVEIGQVVSTQSQMAQLVGTDTFLVQVAVPLDRIALIDVPGVNASEGAAVKIRQDVGKTPIVRDGSVLRLLGDLDPVGRMGRIIVTVNDPFGLKLPPAERGLPLLIGAFVSVSLAGGESQNVITLPRNVIHEGNALYVYSKGVLDVRKVNVVWRDEDEVLVRGGIEPGETYVTTRIGTPIPGMKLRLADEKADTASERAEVTP